MRPLDILIAGAGPAGMAAAIAGRRCGLEVMVVDEQPAPGGQIWRSVETAGLRDDILGSSYFKGRAAAEAFRASGALYEPGSQIWKIEPGFRIFISRDRQPKVIRARAVILATGAQERPAPFPGWTLPGVLTVGAAQVLLKTSGQIPTRPVWIAGCGPLTLLYAVQLLKAGGRIAGFLDTTPAGQWKAAMPHLPAALRGWRELAKGLGWLATLRRRGVPVITGITEIEALGSERVEALRYRTKGGAETTVVAETVLVHEGVVPSIHAALSLDCDVAWNPAQECYAPIVDQWGESSLTGLFIAGDGAGIAGAKAATLRGKLAALKIAVELGGISMETAARTTRAIQRSLSRELAARPFLDAMFRPRNQIFTPANNTIVCRCEEVTAGAIRTLAKVGRPGPNQIKAATRVGMGPCQGRQCGYTVNRILAAEQNRPAPEVGYLHVRPPLKPITLGELAALHRTEGA